MKVFKKIICLVLVIAMGLGPAASVYAQSKAVRYIDDIKIGYGEEGKNQLIAAGYKVDSSFDANKYGRGKDSDTAVYIGFHETDDPLDAITDVALMSMNGDYTFSGWEEELAQLTESINEMLYDFIAGIEEFRANYTAGSPYAQKAYEAMNFFSDEGFTDKRIGDLLKNANTSTADISNVFLKGNYKFITSIKQCIAMACTEWKQDENGNYDTFITRLNNGGYSYGDIDPSMNHERELVGNAISNLRPDIEDAEIKRDEYYASYSLVKENYTLSAEEIPAGADAEQIDTLQFEKYIKDQCSEEAQFNYVYFQSLIEILNNITVKPEKVNSITGETDEEKETFYDIVMKKSEDLKETDLETIRKAMTAGQLGVLESVGFPNLLLFANGVSTCDAEAAFDETMEEFDEYDTDVVSVYYGVDLGVFDDPENTALTKDAHNAMKNGEVSAFGQKEIEKTTLQKAAFYVHVVIGLVALAVGIYSATGFGVALHTAATSEYLLTQSFYAPTLEASTGWIAAYGVITVVCIAVAVLCIIAAIKSKEKKYEQQADISYVMIPARIVDAKTVKEIGVAEQKVYYTYTCAKRIDANESSGNTLEIYGDLNQYNKKDQWLSVYYTKNRDCGDPITSDVMLTESSAVPTGYAALHEFGTSAALNLNRYNSGENKKPIYGYIKTTTFDSASDDQTASVFSRGTIVMIAAGAFIAGAGISAAAVYTGTKKKYRKETC